MRSSLLNGTLLSANNLQRWIHFLYRLHTLAENPHQPTAPVISLLKSSFDFNHLKQIISHIITNTIPICPTSLMKLIDISLSSSGPHFASLIFIQFSDSIDTRLCNSIIRSYTQSNQHIHSILVYTWMRSIGIPPDSSTIPALIKSITRLSCQGLGKSIHGSIIQMGFHSDIYINTALVHMYATCASISEAHQLFDEMPERNSVSWNAMITGYAHNRGFREALELFRHMQIVGVEPSEVTMVSVLSACAHLAALNQGKWIHNYVNQQGFRTNVFVCTALIDMYSKCGVIDEAEKVFRVMRFKNVYTWNALISGLAMNGQGEAALCAFSDMINENFKPDGVTFLAVLCACCHQGLVDEARDFFIRMEKKYELRSGIEHYGCMVDILGRAGLLDEALELIKTMPVKVDAAVWRALLSACRIHGNAELGELAIGKLLELEPDNGENYVMLANLFARNHRWNKIVEIRELMDSRGVQKVPGCSSIEVGDDIYEFVVTDQNKNIGLDEIYVKLADMNRELKLAGYIADTEMVTYDIEGEEKENSLMYHSEKLALAFGILRTPPGSNIRIVKNLRICRDCHGFFKLVSKVYCREISVRDRNRFHHFSAGICSCRDYW